MAFDIQVGEILKGDEKYDIEVVWDGNIVAKASSGLFDQKAAFILFDN